MQTITRAADLLNISELKFLSEAYLNWFGDHADEEDMMFLFTHFMMFGEVPDWVEQYAQQVLADIDANRRVNPNSFCVLNLAPRMGNKTQVGFSLHR